MYLLRCAALEGHDLLRLLHHNLTLPLLLLVQPPLQLHLHSSSRPKQRRPETRDQTRTRRAGNEQQKQKPDMKPTTATTTESKELREEYMCHSPPLHTAKRYIKHYTAATTSLAPRKLLQGQPSQADTIRRPTKQTDGQWHQIRPLKPKTADLAPCLLCLAYYS